MESEMIRLIAFVLVAATTPAFAQNYQPYNPNAPQHYNNAPGGLYSPGPANGAGQPRNVEVLANLLRGSPEQFA
jgi:hypothetical protein